jgi:hypothetical protein
MLSISQFNRASYQNILWQTIAITLVLSLRLLFDGNVEPKSWNEADVLPLAKHYIDRQWISQDWYLDRGAGYRFLFQTIAGWLAIHFGFLATSIIGRLSCYILVAWGFVLIGKQLQLEFRYLLLAVILATFPGWKQGAIAGEWFVGGFEAKSLAYSMVMLAIPLMLGKRYLGMTLLLGLATSFHVLVGGWAFVTTLFWLCFRPNIRLFKLKRIGFLLILLYILGSIFAIPAVAEQLLSPELASAIPPSYIYVFLRLPHHLNPRSWHLLFWLSLVLYICLFAWSLVSLKRLANRQKLQRADLRRFELAEFALMSLIPFGIGIIVSFFDTQGRWLQYYPFRFGDIILPIVTCLLFCCWLQSRATTKAKWLTILLGFILSIQSVIFSHQALALKDFPSAAQNVDPQWKVMSHWIKDNTPQDAVVVSHPVELTNFTWLTERGTIAKVKLLPQTEAEILEYFERLDDLSGDRVLRPYVDRGSIDLKTLVDILSEGYENLNTQEALVLMQKYHAGYFLTDIQHPLDLPIAHRYDPYLLYRATN